MTEKEDQAYLFLVKKKIAEKEKFSSVEITELVDRFEDMLDMNAVTVKIIDRLMNNYNTLKLKSNKILSDQEN